MSTKASGSGLEGVVVAETALSDVDGEHGRLVIAGHDVEALAPRVTYEQAVAALWRAAGLAVPEELGAALGRARVAAAERLARTGDALAMADGMDALRAAVAHGRRSGDAVADGIALLAAVGVSAAAWASARAGRAMGLPDANASHAEDVLRLATGVLPDAARVRALDTYLVAVIDHGMNASAFAARVVASTGSDEVSAVVAAIGALKGPLHGGAPGPVLDMLDAIGDAASAEAWLRAEIASGRRIMGMGHRIYRVRDPRAAVLEGAVERLARAVGAEAGRRLAIARAVERAATVILEEKRPDRPLCANVEFFTAVLLDAIGLERASFAPMFASARVAGWLAHVAEQRAGGRLIRPSSRYVGAWPAEGSAAAMAKI